MEATFELGVWPPTLPSLAPRETLYSWCATVHRRSVSGNVLSTSRRLFGSNYSALLHDFPARLGELARRTDGRIGPPRELALKHTLLGHFLPFIRAASGEAILRAVEMGSVPALKMRLGIPASGIGGYHPMRWCAECVRRDRHDIGWPIWYVDHQSPSTLVCTEHHRPLVQTWHAISPVHRREWLMPDGHRREPRHEITVRDDKTLTILLRLATLSANLFQVEPGKLDPSTTSRIYRYWAARDGGVTRGGSVRHATVQARLQAPFKLVRDAFADLGPASCSLSLEGILSSVIRNTPKPAHPTKHLVLMALMLDQEIELSEMLAITSTPEQDIKSPSTTAAAEQQRAQELDARRGVFLELVGKGGSVRAAALDVGVSANTGVRWAAQAGVKFKSRAKALKGAHLESVESALRLGADRGEVGRQHGISLTSVHRILSTNHELRDEWAKARHELAKRRHRAAIQAAYTGNPQCTQRDLRSREGASWAWLYRHDREWLMTSTPSLWS